MGVPLPSPLSRSAISPDHHHRHLLHHQPSVDPLPNTCGGTYYGNWTKKEKRQIMTAHIKNDTLRYNNTMAAWDVVNEAICDCQVSTA